MPEKKDSCKGLFGALFGHKFEARYDKKDNTTAPGNFSSIGIPDYILEEALVSENLQDIIAAANGDSSSSTYVHDICVRCGEVVVRTPEVKA